MSQREVHIVLAHALNCSLCRGRLLANASSVFRGRALTDEEKEVLSQLTEGDFSTVDLLAREAGTTPDALRSYADHAVVRLRHF